MKNTLRSIAALVTAPIILALTLASACAPTRTAQPLATVMTGPTAIAAGLTAGRCAELIGETSSTHFDDCILAAEDARCEREGWCD